MKKQYLHSRWMLIASMCIFSTIGIVEYLIGMGLAFTVIPVVELIKLIQRTVSAKKHN